MKLIMLDKYPFNFGELTKTGVFPIKVRGRIFFILNARPVFILLEVIMNDKLPMNMPVGLFWYRDENEYNLCTSQYVDDDLINDSFGEWLKRVENLVKQLEALNNTVVKVYPYPDFFIWCKSVGVALDAASRNAYASRIAAGIHFGKDIKTDGT
jgi:hypothetical protein